MATKSVEQARQEVTGYLPESHKKMPHRRLGRTGLKVSVLSFGTWVTLGQQVGLDATYEMVKAAYDAGCNLFDCAEVYASGQAETLLGQAVKRLIEKDNVKRENLVITTKLFWGGDGVNQGGLSRKHIVEGMRNSLKRLQLDYVDIVFAHRPDRDTPIDETVRAFSWLIDQGMSMYWGTSEWDASEIQAAISYAREWGLHEPVTEQSQYNMIHRKKVDSEYWLLQRDYQFGNTIWSPLASGILTGKYLNGNMPADSRIGTSGDWGLKSLKEALQKGDGLWTEEKSVQKVNDKLMKLQPVAARLGATLAQLAVAWCAVNPNVSTVLTGASKVSQVVENFKAVSLIEKLTPEVMKEIDGILENKPDAPRRFR